MTRFHFNQGSAEENKQRYVVFKVKIVGVFYYERLFVQVF